MPPLISYQLSGQGFPLIFLHGLGASRLQTIQALRSLSNTQLIAPDFRAHGESLYEKDELSFNQFADDVISILDKLDLEKVDIGGLSMGAGVTLNIALSYPERINRMVILRPSWLDYKQPSHLKLVADVGRWIQHEGIKSASQKLEADRSFQILKKSNLAVALSIASLFQRPQAQSGAAVLYRMWEDCPFDSLDKLTSLKHRALVLYTTLDDLHPISIAKAIAEKLPNVQQAELPPRYLEPLAYEQALVAKIHAFLKP